MKIWTIVCLTIALLLAGCQLGANYKRPKTPVPAEYRAAVPYSNQASMAEMKWFDLFQDDQLKALIQTALQQNYDMRIASARVLQARALYGITRSNLFPTVSADVGANSFRPSESAQFAFPDLLNAKTSNYTSLGLNLGWEVDVWGRIRRLTEASRAEYLAQENVQRGVITTLVADVATAYFDLRELDLELEIAHSTLATREKGLRLTTLRRNQGVESSLAVRQSEDLLYSATAQIAQIERLIEQKENQICLLVARNPGDIVRGKPLSDQYIPPVIPAGLPSSLLERRPDIREAEQSLIAANARIGAAKSAYFPRITLTGFLGTESQDLGNLFTGPTRAWNFIANASMPIFTAGRIKSGVKFAEAQQKEALARYEQSIQTAFREISDALIGYRKTREERAQQELLVKAREESRRLSERRWVGGLDSYLQVLDADRNLFEGQLQLAQLRRNELLAVVEVYRALGGGWQ
ncbi:MAG: efflux transporter outer membrane subunit [Blastocatellia bacterium]|nr:efflux transporter outer membrane subunit [Blastocatellia bacterium]